MPTPEETIAESLGVLFLRSFRTSVTAEIVKVAPEAVDLSTYPIISGVARTGPIRVAALGEEVGLERSVVARRAARLIEAGLLRSTPAPDDARAALISLTPEGERVTKVMRKTFAGGLATHLRSWSTRDRETFARLIARFVEDDLGASDESTEQLHEV